MKFILEKYVVFSLGILFILSLLLIPNYEVNPYIDSSEFSSLYLMDDYQDDIITSDNANSLTANITEKKYLFILNSNPKEILNTSYHIRASPV